MWKNIKYYFFLIAFFCMLIGPQILYKLSDKDANAENAENRTLAERPDLSFGTLKEYPVLFDEYYNDNIAYKSKFIKINQLANYYLFGTAENNKSVLGNDNWLFFKDDYSIEDYQGTIKYSDEQILGLVNQIVAVDEYYKSLGKEFILFIAPNKESIYGENLPSKYSQYEDCTRADQVYDYLINNTDVKVVSPKEELRKLKDEYQLYYKYDTHWNDIGAYISTNYLLSRIGMKPMEDVSKADIIEDGEHIGDLATMLTLTDIFYTEPELQLDKFTDIEVTNIYSKPHSIVFNEKYTSTSDNEKKLYIVGDSFSAKLEEYMKFSFAESTVIHRSAYTPGLSETDSADVIVCEVVERYIEQMGNLTSIFIPAEDGE